MNLFKNYRSVYLLLFISKQFIFKISIRQQLQQMTTEDRIYRQQKMRKQLKEQKLHATYTCIIMLKVQSVSKYRSQKKNHIIVNPSEHAGKSSSSADHHVMEFLQRDSIACYAERCISYDRFCPTV